jgi:hypothetical protein
LATQGLACIQDLKKELKDMINLYFDEKRKIINKEQKNENFLLNVKFKILINLEKKENK